LTDLEKNILVVIELAEKKKLEKKSLDGE